jgi:hypothetical protein
MSFYNYNVATPNVATFFVRCLLVPAMLTHGPEKLICMFLVHFDKSNEKRHRTVTNRNDNSKLNFDQNQAFSSQ